MRNVLVSGGSRGLGLAIGRKLAAAGCGVIAIARKKNDQIAAAIKDIEKSKTGSLHFVPFDLNNVDDIGELVRNLRKQFGPVYGLVNNAAIGTEGLLGIMPNPQIEQLIRVNTLAPIVLTKFVVRSMMSEGGGRIVNVTSIIGFTGYSGLSVYGATKASMLGFTRSLAREVGRMGVTVNAVAPGFMDTEMTSSMSDDQRAKIAGRAALKRLVDVEDVAAAVAFLMSEAAKNITGTTMTVDAGNTA